MGIYEKLGVIGGLDESEVGMEEITEEECEIFDELLILIFG